MPATSETSPAHSIFGGSSYSIWGDEENGCEQYVLMNKLFPDQDDTDEASEGSVAHRLLEVCLCDFSLDPEALLGSEVDGVVVDDEMVEAIGIAVDWVRDTLAECGEALLYVEKRVDLSPYVGTVSTGEEPNVFGTADIIIDAGDTLWVVDFKYGKGLLVSVHGNKQLEFYTLGALNELGDHFTTINHAILQPRCGADPISVVRDISWNTEASADRLRSRVEAVCQRMASGECAARPSQDNCRFCHGVNGNCRAVRQSTALAVPGTEQDPVLGGWALPPAEALTNEQLGMLLDWVWAVNKLATNAKKEAQRRAEEGQRIPGKKLVRKKGNRKWVPGAIDQLFARIGPSCMEEPKLKRPAQIDKVAKKIGLDPSEYLHLIERSERVALVDESDKAPALDANPFKPIRK